MSYPTIYVKPTIDTKGLCSVVNHCLTELQMHDHGLIDPSLRTREELLYAIHRKYIKTKEMMADPFNVRLWNKWDFYVAEQALGRIEKYLLTGKIDPVTEEA